MIRLVTFTGRVADSLPNTSLVKKQPESTILAESNQSLLLSICSAAFSTCLICPSSIVEVLLKGAESLSLRRLDDVLIGRTVDKISQRMFVSFMVYT